LLMVAGFFLLFESVQDSFTNTGDCVVGGEDVLRDGCDPAGGGGAPAP
jgi:hypothetical protein